MMPYTVTMRSSYFRKHGLYRIPLRPCVDLYVPACTPCCMYVGMCVSAHGFRHGSFCKERRSERKRGKKRGRVLQWQTQSVMQDYSVSFSTAIDVVFMGETQGFSKRSGPCYPCSTLETKAEGGGGWRGFSSRPPPRGLCHLMATVSIPLLPGDRLVATSASTSVPLARWRWDHYFAAAEKEVTLEDSRPRFSFCARWSCVFERLFLLLCS